jgi:hypothetical protein
MTKGQQYLVATMAQNGNTLRQICDTFPEIPAHEISRVVFPPTQEVVTPEDRILRAIFGD